MRVNEGKLPRILSVKSAGEFRLRLRFANGKSFAVDLSREVQRSKPYRPLRDQALFARVALGEGGHSVLWPVGELDMGADKLWQYALEQNGRTDAAEFIRWRWRNGLSLTASAEALGPAAGCVLRQWAA
jgi:hypothetical protein